MSFQVCCPKSLRLSSPIVLFERAKPKIGAQLTERRDKRVTMYALCDFDDDCVACLRRGNKTDPSISCAPNDPHDWPPIHGGPHARALNRSTSGLDYAHTMAICGAEGSLAE